MANSTKAIKPEADPTVIRLGSCLKELFLSSATTRQKKATDRQQNYQSPAILRA
jgi:hypothetical protein